MPLRPSRVRLRSAAVSDTGVHRAVNQDAAFTAPWGGAVADGVGGGPAGDLASAAFAHRLAAGRVGTVDPETLAVSVRHANWDLRAHVERDPSLSGMATTFTGVFVSETDTLLLAHTGDSRAYLLRDGVLTQQTRDDSYVQALVDRGLVTAQDAASHPRRNLITASLSGGERDRVMVAEHEARAGDRWVLCSDGLSDYVPHEDIAEAVTGRSASEAAADAVARALEAGTRDNVTVVVCDIEVGEAVSFSARPDTSFYGAAAARFTEGLESA
ncbi:PP2C family protein-serine/threonine phosphatase [Microbacterium sp. SSM24]|uniref:PP2C family protein-serine/threonine phosphatase n=1 Tax=Microbacterium sp. SSM24 TaxID=2991714 RepID=UPI002225F3C2|nr:protein phosphatase 2C domain-containing protein [Microbacterium sp. SSM24]MCW3494726.1 protein phosphatase 2C domain-containing protein [Microbacterium sp. SSM24]